MSAFWHLYCKRTLAHLTPAALAAGIAPADFHTEAEGYEVPEEQVEAALSYLSIEAEGDGFSRWALRYRPEGMRQVYIWRSDKPQEVAELLNEAREAVHGLRKGARTIKRHLAETQEVVSIELGWGQLGDMGIVLAYEVARWLATEGDGLMRDHEDVWWILRRGVFHRVAP